MKKYLIKFACVAFVLSITGISTQNVVGQSATIPCPGGDKYKCYTKTDPDGGSVTAYKGDGDTEIKIDLG